MCFGLLKYISYPVMDIRNFLPRKRSVSEELDGNEEDGSKSDTQVTVTDAAEPSISCLQSTSSTMLLLCI